MSSQLSHIDRTASEPRQNTFRKAVVSGIADVNFDTRLIRLALSDALSFLPGQWLDCYIAGIPRAGGFSITSTPAEAAMDEQDPGYLELAIKSSPTNPHATWFFAEKDDIIGKELHVRVGGSLTWPPQEAQIDRVDRLVMVAGGVGIK